MWHLTGDDIQRAKEELKGRRDAIKAHYDSEMKQLEADIAAIETFERAAVDFVSNFKGEDEPSATVADPEPAPEPVVADSVRKKGGPASEESSPASGETPVEQSAEAEAAPEPAPIPEPAAGGKGSSRWRMRLSTTEGSP
jgi:hypothetical protein